MEHSEQRITDSETRPRLVPFYIEAIRSINQVFKDLNAFEFYPLALQQLIWLPILWTDLANYCAAIFFWTKASLVHTSHGRHVSIKEFLVMPHELPSTPWR